MSPAEVCELLAEARRRVAFRSRLVLADGSMSSWSSWLTSPAAGYLEIASEGPRRLSELSAVEIDPTETIRTGKYAEDIHVNHRQEVLLELEPVRDRVVELPVGLIRIRFD